MSRQLDQVQEDRRVRRDKAVLRALDFELVGTFDAQGITLTGLSARWNEYDCLVTLKGVVDGEKQVAFVGSDCLTNCLVKVVTDARNDRVRWRQDKYA